MSHAQRDRRSGPASEPFRAVHRARRLARARAAALGASAILGLTAAVWLMPGIATATTGVPPRAGNEVRSGVTHLLPAGGPSAPVAGAATVTGTHTVAGAPTAPAAPSAAIAAPVVPPADPLPSQTAPLSQLPELPPVAPTPDPASPGEGALPPAGPPRTPGAASPRAITIGIDAIGYQPELDRCLWVRMDIGAVAPIVGAHNYCGGEVVLELQVGDRVHMAGAGLDGDFVVTGSRDAHAGDDAGAATRGLVASVILQTCYLEVDALRLVTLVPRAA